MTDKIKKRVAEEYNAIYENNKHLDEQNDHQQYTVVTELPTYMLGVNEECGSKPWYASR